MRNATREIIRRAASIAGSQLQLSREIDARTRTLGVWFNRGTESGSNLLKVIEYATGGQITASIIIDAIAQNENMKIKRILNGEDGDCNNALEKAIKIAGNTSNLARRIGVSHQAIHIWKVKYNSRIPEEKVLKIYIATGVTPHEMRPDLYPNPNDGI
ncbi:YdaS family helix-turn-helix protein [Morganella morganii]|uniref:transcriptional regulator n=1 Tax=Morganella morganii TaxID=582 RepID=UPI003EBFA013